MGKEAGVLADSPRVVTRGWDSQKATGAGSGATADVLGIHWLRGSVHESERLWLIDRLCTLWGEQREEHEYGFWTYDRHLLWPSGVKLLYHSTEEGGELTFGRIALEIPGSALDQLDLWQTLMFMTALNERNFQCSRMDVYFDDHQRTVTPMALWTMVYEESLFEGAPLRHDIMGFRAVKKITESDRTGRKHDELCLGRRGKCGVGKYLRIYDKRLESKGEIDAVRWELELSDHYARGAFGLIVASMSAGGSTADWKPEWTTRVLGGLIAWAVDFKQRVPGEKNLSRLARYPFWQAILNRLGSAKLCAKRVVKRVEKAVEWVTKGVAGTLQMMRLALGDEKAIPLVCDLAFREDKLRPAHRRAIADYLRLQESPPGSA